MFLLALGRIKGFIFVQLFTVYLRYLIGSAFIIAAIGMGKLSDGVFLLNSNSKSICELQPMQQFFRVMADSGLYWKFIGWTQILAGTLLITQRFARIGALIFFGIILNIFVITVSYKFTGTPILTGLMLSATLYLLLWDADSLQFLFRMPSNFQASQPKEHIHTDPFWAILGVCLILCIVVTIQLKFHPFMVMVSTLLTRIAGLMVFFMCRSRLTNRRHTG